MELYLMLCGSLDGRGVWGRIKTWHVWLCVFAVHLKLSQHCQSAAVAVAAAAKWLQSRSTLCDPMDSSPPGSSVHGILQAGIAEWVAIFLLQGFFLDPGIEPRSPVSPALAGRFFTAPPEEAYLYLYIWLVK